MDRVQTLCKKLQEQLDQHAGADQLLLTVQMLQSELMHLKAGSQQVVEPLAASIQIPANMNVDVKPATPGSEPEKEIAEPEKTIMVLEIDEAAVEAELEEIKRNAKTRDQISIQNKPQLLFDPIEDIPTLTHQGPQKEKATEIHEKIGANQVSLNDVLKQSKIELSDTLQDTPVKDLKKAIGINDRFLFIRELFRGDEVMYERSIKTINGFTIYPEAEYWIKRELKLKLGWNDSSPDVKLFDQMVKRRFPSM